MATASMPSLDLSHVAKRTADGDPVAPPSCSKGGGGGKRAEDTNSAEVATITKLCKALANPPKKATGPLKCFLAVSYGDEMAMYTTPELRQSLTDNPELAASLTSAFLPATAAPPSNLGELGANYALCGHDAKRLRAESIVTKPVATKPAVGEGEGKSKSKGKCYVALRIVPRDDDDCRIVSAVSAEAMRRKPAPPATGALDAFLAASIVPYCANSQ